MLANANHAEKASLESALKNVISINDAMYTGQRRLSHVSAQRFDEVCEKRGSRIEFLANGDVLVTWAGALVAVMYVMYELGQTVFCVNESLVALRLKHLH